MINRSGAGGGDREEPRGIEKLMLHGLIQSRTLLEVAADTPKRLNPVGVVVAFSNCLECVFESTLPQAKTDLDNNT